VSSEIVVRYDRASFCRLATEGVRALRSAEARYERAVGDSLRVRSSALSSKARKRPSVASCRASAVVPNNDLGAHRAAQQVGGKVIRAGKYRALPMLGDGIRIEQLAEGRYVMDCHDIR